MDRTSHRKREQCTILLPISRIGQYKTRLTNYGLGIKHGLGYKTRTKHYGLGMKYGLGYKTRTEHYGLGIKHLERFYIE